MGDILKARTKKNILVIGGTGFCGTHLTRRLPPGEEIGRAHV